MKTHAENTLPNCSAFGRFIHPAGDIGVESFTPEEISTSKRYFFFNYFIILYLSK